MPKHFRIGMTSQAMENWILLRGLTRETSHWGSFIGAFQQGLPASRVIAVDIPGNGNLNAVASPMSIQAMVSSCRAELLRLGIAPPYYLFAMSLGAMVATEWSYLAPHEIEGCVLINTSLRPFSPFYQRLQTRNYLPLLRLVLFGGGAVHREQTILRLTSNKACERASVIPDWVAARMRHPVTATNALRQLLAAARYTAHREPPATRMMLLASSQDHLVDAACSHAIASSWQCPLALHPSAGHDLPLDDPSWVIDQVQRWLKASSSSRREMT